MEVTPRGNETRLLYAGPLDNAKAVFGFGKFHLFAEIWDEAGAFASSDINTAFTTIMPTREQYEAYDIAADIKKYKDTGDAGRISMILQADASCRQGASWMSLEDLAGDKSREDMTIKEGVAYDNLMKDLTNANTQLINDAAENLEFNSIEQLDQGAGTLYSITSQLVKGGDVSKTLDMKGREAAVKLVDKMADGFGKMTISDPNKLKAFIEGTTGSIVAILSSLNNVLYSNNPDDIPLTDIEAAASLPYDTDIPDGNADIPEDPKEAEKQNAMKITRIDAVAQVKKMVDLVDNIAGTALKSMVIGETLDTKAPLGVSMKLSKVSGSHTVGKDLNGDGIPDIPLVYTFDATSEVEFPLNFCPGERFDWVETNENGTKEKLTQMHITPDHLLMPCVGFWGISIKEWQVIKQTYPASAQNLNLLTRTVDVDVYDENEGKVIINRMPLPIKVKTKRMKEKDKYLGLLKMPEPRSVNVEKRIDLAKRRKRLPIIYHKITVNRTYSTINVQMKGFNPYNKLAILAKYGKMMKADDCDFIQVVSDINARDEEWYDYFIGVDKVKNQTGDWFFGIAALDDIPESVSIEHSCKDLNGGSFSHDFNMTNENPNYDIRIYSGGCYYFNETTEEWVGIGINVTEGGNNILTRCETDHLTSFGTGFFPAPNHIDFEFIFTETDIADNVTILMVLMITFFLFLVTLIWAQIRDRKDIEDIKPHYMKDNLPEDHYFYEVLVQTGPMLSHGTESKVQFILTGEDNATQIRTLSDPTKNFFKKGAIDTFLMAVDKPLGHLQYIKIWHDNSGIREMQPWYLSYMIIHDLQTGEKFRFLADRWLAIDRADFDCEIQVAVTMPMAPADTSFLVRQGIFNKLRDDHVFWSVFSRPIRSRFTRVQRTCVSMATLYLAMLANGIWYKATPQYLADPLVSMAGMINLSAEEVSKGIFSSIIIFVPAVLMISLFRKAIPSSKRESRFNKVIKEAAEAGLVNLPEKTFQRPPNAKDIPKGWPSYCYFIGWLVVILCILGGMAMVGLFGVSFGNNTCYQWVTAMVVNFFWQMFFESIVKVAIIALFIALIRRTPDWNQDHVDVDEEMPTIYHDPEHPDISGRKHKEKAEAPEFDPAYLEPLRDRRMMEGEMNTVIMDIMVYLVYVIIVIVISYGNRDSNMFHMKNNLETTLIHGGLRCGWTPDAEPCDRDEDLPFWDNPYNGRNEQNWWIDFMKVRDVNQWWKWMNSTLLPNVRVQPWYNGDPPYGLRGYLDDRVNRIIGYALVRQIREIPGNCRSPILMRDYIDSCTGDLLVGNQQTC